MRIVGIGIDAEKIALTSASISRYGDSWLKRQFTALEIKRMPDSDKQAIYFTSLFSIKEAVSKALGNGIDEELSLLSIEILLDGSKVESITLEPSTISLLTKLGIERITAGVTLFSDHIIATAIAEG